MNHHAILIAVLFAYMSLWFLVALIRKRNDVADVAWGLGFVLVAWASLLISDDVGTRGFLVTTMVTLWGVRLAWHIHARNRGKGEDYRYLAWRNEWGKWFYVRSYVQVYLLQGSLLYLIALPVILINANGSIEPGVPELFGVAVWLFGFYFEVVGDAQLARFIKDASNKGKLLQSGLWAYSRHPNYFGEVTQWWGIWLMALSLPSGWLTIIGPLTITYLILKVSGIPMLEKKMEEHPDFAEYKRTTSMFIPLPKK